MELFVLIVEDSDLDAKMLLRELRHGGYEVSYEQVDTAEEMQAALSRRTWDIVISDYIMPNFDGLTALHILKECDQDIPFIIVSGSVGEDIAVEAMLNGANDYLMKDNLTRLIPAVARELEDSKIRRERREAQKALHEAYAELEHRVEERTAELANANRQLQLEISERTRAEEEVRRINAELEQRVINRTAQLEATVKEIEAFSYSISHDLRAPLRAINGFSKMLIEDYNSALPAEAQRYVGLMAENAKRMGVLIDSLLSFSRLSRLALVKEVVSPNNFINEIIRDLTNEYKEREIEVTVDPLPPCQAEPTLFRQVFFNLVANAFKFTAPQKVAKIHIGYDGNAYFVRDNGIGFDMRYVDKIFGVFQRLHTVEEYEGTGIGLALVQRIIQRHGGKVWVEAEPDKGASFYFTLGCEFQESQI